MLHNVQLTIHSLLIQFVVIIKSGLFSIKLNSDVLN